MPVKPVKFDANLPYIGGGFAVIIAGSQHVLPINQITIFFLPAGRFCASIVKKSTNCCAVEEYVTLLVLLVNCGLSIDLQKIVKLRKRAGKVTYDGYDKGYYGRTA